jgi:hypothetical protein
VHHFKSGNRTVGTDRKLGSEEMVFTEEVRVQIRKVVMPEVLGNIFRLFFSIL